jgi:hypothetical protein
MASAVQKIKLSPSRDIPFNKLVLSQSNVRRVKAGVSIEQGERRVNCLAAGMQARRRSLNHGACTRGFHLRRKSAAHPEGAVACYGRA